MASPRRAFLLLEGEFRMCMSSRFFAMKIWEAWLRRTSASTDALAFSLSSPVLADHPVLFLLADLFCQRHDHELAAALVVESTKKSFGISLNRCAGEETPSLNRGCISPSAPLASASFRTYSPGV